MARSLFAVALVVCALVAAAMAQDTITISAGSFSFSGTGTFAGNTYSSAGPLTITFSPAGVAYTGGATITVSANNVAVTISNSGSSNGGLTLSGTGSTLNVAASSSVTFNALVLSSGGALTIPATASLTVITAVTSNVPTVSVAGTFTANAGLTLNNIATPTITGTLSTTTGNIALTFPNALTTANVAAGSTVSSTSGNVVITTVGGTFAGTATTGGAGTVQVTGTLTSALTTSGTLSTTGTGTVTVNPTGAQAITVGGTVTAGAAVSVSDNAATSITLSATTTATSLTLTSTANNAVVTLSGAATLSGALTLTSSGATGTSIVVSSAVTGATTVSFNTPGSVSIPASGSISFTGAQTLVTNIASTVNIAGMLLGSTTVATSSVALNPTGALTISGTVTAGTALNSLQLNAGAASTVTGTLTSGANIVFGATGAGAYGSTTYAINGATLNFASAIHFNSPTTFNGVTFTAPAWTVIVSGGSAVTGPSSTYDLTAAGNTINTSLFPSGSNTNCVWVQSYTGSTVSNFLVSLPGNIQYRNWVSASSTALTVSSTNGGTVSFCTPNIQSTFDRRNDPNRNNLVYFGGNVIYYFTTSMALPFGTITASDFTVVGGVISSITTIAGSSPTAYQIVVQITCDGVVNLAYNGSWTGTGTFLGEVSLNNQRVVSAKCISNIYAPCS